ncbi:MAG: radical SAM protein [Candidatus Aminicenantes bacterium]|nr:radical SAM protein [Candidatus Aminicenantes bacterium]
MQEIRSLTLVLSDRCNFSCPYCPQRTGKNTLAFKDIRVFLDFLNPRLAGEVWLGFYGGEPLSSWPLIEKTVAYTKKEQRTRFRLTLTTNGSLLKKELILFLKRHRFALVLSYDGLAQKYRDPGSVAAVERALAGLKELYPEGYTVHSVFTPRTVPLLAASMRRLMGQGHARLQYALDTSAPWGKADLAALEKQLCRLLAIFAEHRRRTGKVPLENFKENGRSGVFACFGGRDRLALLPDRTVWGCEMFHTLLGNDPHAPDYAQFCFGALEEFMSLPAKGFNAVAANYAELRQDYFFTEKGNLCSLCANLENCSVCPAAAALATGIPAVIPEWTCRINRLSRAAAGPTRRRELNLS